MVPKLGRTIPVGLYLKTTAKFYLHKLNLTYHIHVIKDKSVQLCKLCEIVPLKSTKGKRAHVIFFVCYRPALNKLIEVPFILYYEDKAVLPHNISRDKNDMFFFSID